MWSDAEIESVLADVSGLGWLVLKRFSAAYRPSDIIAAFATLPKREFDLLRRLHFGLSEMAGAFLTVHVPNFLRFTPSSTEHVVEDRAGPPRARIDWARTLARRSQSGFDAGRFVTRPVERTSDSSAARLVGYMARLIAENADRLKGAKIPQAAAHEIEELGRLATRQLGILQGRGVRVPSKLTGREVAHLRRTSREDVRSAILLFDLHVQLMENANENILRDLLKRRHMAPENLDDLFEVWGLLTFVQLHLEEGWILQQAHLIGGDHDPKRPRFTLEKDGAAAEIFFQTVPAEMVKVSTYKELFANYDLPVAIRRPDISLKLTVDEQPRHMIVEVKRTSDPGYITDSVYKTIGYISDFKRALGPGTPLAILLVWEGVSPINDDAATMPLVIKTAEQFRSMKLPY
jgi:hypothetical protein